MSGEKKQTEEKKREALGRGPDIQFVEKLLEKKQELKAELQNHQGTTPSAPPQALTG